MIKFNKVADGNIPEGVAIIGYKESWIDLDFNQRGTRECFFEPSVGWISAAWDNCHDCYVNNVDEPEYWCYYPIPPNPMFDKESAKLEASMEKDSTPNKTKVQICPSCKGYGELSKPPYDDSGVCPDCKGSGKL